MQGGHFSTTAKVTMVVTAVFNGCMLVLYSVHRYLLEQLMTEEDKDVAAWSSVGIRARQGVARR
jgi:hypothetical protein